MTGLNPDASGEVSAEFQRDERERERAFSLLLFFFFFFFCVRGKSGGGMRKKGLGFSKNFRKLQNSPPRIAFLFI